MPEQLRNMLRLEINIPNLIAIVGVLVTVVTGWTQLQAQTSRNSDDIQDLEKAVETKFEKVEADQKERRNRDMDTTRVLAEMRADLRYLRDTIERRIDKSLP